MRSEPKLRAGAKRHENFQTQRLTLSTRPPLAFLSPDVAPRSDRGDVVRGQDVIAFPPRRVETPAAKEWSVSLKTIRLARELYDARAEFLGGLMPWDELTVGQRTNFYLEMEGYVRFGKGDSK